MLILSHWNITGEITSLTGSKGIQIQRVYTGLQSEGEEEGGVWGVGGRGMGSRREEDGE